MKQQIENFAGPGGAHYQWSMFGARGPMREGEKDPKAGGAGGDNKFKLDDDSKKEIVDLIHSTFTEREKRDTKKRQKEMTDAITAAVAAALGKDPADPEIVDPEIVDPPAKKLAAKGGKKEEDPNHANLPPEIQALLKKNARDIEDLKKRATTAEDEKMTERKERLANEEIQALTEGLNGKVRSGTVKGLVKYLRGERLVRDEDDPTRILWKGDKDGELLPLGDGIKHWLNTEEGKEYIPAAAGAGGGGTGKPFSGKGPGSGDGGVATDAEIGSLLTQRMR